MADPVLRAEVLQEFLEHLSAPSPGDALRSKSAIRCRGQKCTQRFFEGFIVRPPTLKNCKWSPEACPDSRRRFFR